MMYVKEGHWNVVEEVVREKMAIPEKMMTIMEKTMASQPVKMTTKFRNHLMQKKVLPYLLSHPHPLG